MKQLYARTGLCRPTPTGSSSPWMPQHRSCILCAFDCAPNLRAPVAIWVQALGLSGIVIISLLFGAMHIGYRSPLAVVFACVVGYSFAYIVRRSGSLLGVSLAHGLANCTMLMLIPLLGNQAAPLLALFPWIAAACAVPALGGVCWLAWKGPDLPR
jgi:hypothetical protein